MYTDSFYSNKSFSIISVLQRRPQAVAVIEGSENNPHISGVLKLYQTNCGVIVRSEVRGLPETDSSCGGRIFAFHIHEGTECSGNMQDPFSGSKSHYNPKNCEHPYHAGDLLPLFSNNEYAFSVFLTNRFSVSEVIGKTVIIHDHPDDFTTQPSGNSGSKIACGIIRRNNSGGC